MLSAKHRKLGFNGRHLGRRVGSVQIGSYTIVKASLGQLVTLPGDLQVLPGDPKTSLDTPEAYIIAGGFSSNAQQDAVTLRLSQRDFGISRLNIAAHIAPRGRAPSWRR